MVRIRPIMPATVAPLWQAIQSPGLPALTSGRHVVRSGGICRFSSSKTPTVDSAAYGRTMGDGPASAASREPDGNSRSQGRVHEESMKPTDIAAPDYFHKVVDCQWACPAHTPVPEYIRLIAEGRYSDAYMINWRSNVFPGILGRTCDRPCEPACRRGRVEENPVAICRLKRVAADFKDDIRGPAAEARAEERQSHRAGRRRPSLARGRARSRPARLSLHGVRSGPEGRRHDADANSEIPPARLRGR